MFDLISRSSPKPLLGIKIWTIDKKVHDIFLNGWQNGIWFSPIYPTFETIQANKTFIKSKLQIWSMWFTNKCRLGPIFLYSHKWSKFETSMLICTELLRNNGLKEADSRSLDQPMTEQKGVRHPHIHREKGYDSKPLPGRRASRTRRRRSTIHSRDSYGSIDLRVLPVH